MHQQVWKRCSPLRILGIFANLGSALFRFPGEKMCILWLALIFSRLHDEFPAEHLLMLLVLASLKDTPVKVNQNYSQLL